jgi:putative ABC transport system substrate-binding protein
VNNRREFVTLLGGTAATWPLVARAQQTGRPIIGFLGSSSGGAYTTRIIDHLRRGLGDAGFIEGHNLVLEYRWAEGRYDRFPALAAELVRHPVAVLVVSLPPWPPKPRQRQFQSSSIRAATLSSSV